MMALKQGCWASRHNASLGCLLEKTRIIGQSKRQLNVHVLFCGTFVPPRQRETPHLNAAEAVASSTWVEDQPSPTMMSISGPISNPVIEGHTWHWLRRHPTQAVCRNLAHMTSLGADMEKPIGKSKVHGRA